VPRLVGRLDRAIHMYSEVLMTAAVPVVAWQESRHISEVEPCVR